MRPDISSLIGHPLQAREQRFPPPVGPRHADDIDGTIHHLPDESGMTVSEVGGSVADGSYGSNSNGSIPNGMLRRRTAVGLPVLSPLEFGNGLAELFEPESAVAPLLRDFQPISLAATNKLARMLQRNENKYVLDRADLATFLGQLQDRFAVLEIDRKREFGYSSCYFDDDLKCYYDHLQGKRLRFKIRIRRYVDTGDTFFEVKLKDRRGATNKRRIPTVEFDPPSLNDEHKIMLHDFYSELYRKSFRHDVTASIIVNYTRFTLVSLAGGERMTVDYGLRFEPVGGSSIEIKDDFIIVETKSSNGRGLADHVLKRQRKRSIKYCSKYCIGAILAGNVERYNSFRSVIKMISTNVPG